MRSNVTALAATLAALALPSLSAAQTFQLFGSDGANSRHESPQNFAMELRFSPWQPMIDSEFSGSGGGPFLQYFGERDGNGVRTAVRDRLLGALELDCRRCASTPSARWASACRWASRDGQRAAYGHAVARQRAGEHPRDGAHVGRRGAAPRRARTAHHDPAVLYGKAGVAASYWWITSGENLARRSAASPRRAHQQRGRLRPGRHGPLVRVAARGGRDATPRLAGAPRPARVGPRDGREPQSNT